MAYATVGELQTRAARQYSERELAAAAALLEDAASMIDARAPLAAEGAKRAVSLRMVLRAMTDTGGVPAGATQGSVGALGYTQSWTIGTGGSAGELYLDRTERLMLGIGNRIGARSPLEDMT